MRRQRTVRAGNSLAKVVELIVSLIELLLLIRFAITLMELTIGGFVQFIYTVTNPFLKPVAGLITPQAAAGMTIDWNILIAMVGYWIIGQILVAILGGFSSSNPDEIPVHVDEVIVTNNSQTK